MATMIQIVLLLLVVLCLLGCGKGKVAVEKKVLHDDDDSVIDVDLGAMLTAVREGGIDLKESLLSVFVGDKAVCRNPITEYNSKCSFKLSEIAVTAPKDAAATKSVQLVIKIIDKASNEVHFQRTLHVQLHAEEDDIDDGRGGRSSVARGRKRPLLRRAFLLGAVAASYGLYHHNEEFKSAVDPLLVPLHETWLANEERIVVAMKGLRSSSEQHIGDAYRSLLSLRRSSELHIGDACRSLGSLGSSGTRHVGDACRKLGSLGEQNIGAAWRGVCSSVQVLSATANSLSNSLRGMWSSLWGMCNAAVWELLSLRQTAAPVKAAVAAGASKGSRVLTVLSWTLTTAVAVILTAIQQKSGQRAGAPAAQTGRPNPVVVNNGLWKLVLDLVQTVRKDLTGSINRQGELGWGGKTPSVYV